MTEIYVLGDFGGQLELFRRTLDHIGVGPDLKVPQGLIVVQVGDVARASLDSYLDSDACISLADELLLANPKQYVQLMGNHEAAMIGRFYSDRAGVHDSPIIRRWWTEASVKLAVGIRTATDSEILVTHAGLTLGQWDLLDRPPLLETVRALNSRVGQPIEQVSNPGALLSGEVNTEADVMWAEVNHEFYEPWIESGRAPFNFVHGHASPYSWRHDDWWPGTPQAVKERTTVDLQGRTTRTRIGVLPNEKPGWARSVDWGVEKPDPPLGTLWHTAGTLLL